MHWPQWLAKLRAAPLLLGLALLLGLLLRLWGLHWPGQTAAEQATAGLIAALAEGRFDALAQAEWQQYFGLLAGLLYVPLQGALRLASLLLGPAGQQAFVVPPLLWGRLVAAGLGTLNLWALYRLCLRLLESRAAALLAAWLLAVSPLLVVQSHFCGADSAVALVVTLTLWAAVKLFQDQRLGCYLLAGLAGGVALGSGPAGWAAVCSLVLAHGLATWQRRPAWWRWLLTQPGVWLVGAVLGLAPILIPWLAAGQPTFSAQVALPVASLSDRLAWLLHLVHRALGWELLLLLAAGLALAVWRRRHDLGVVAAQVLLTLPLGLLWGRVPGEALLAALLPAAICLAVFAPRWALGRIVPPGLRPWVWAALGLVLLITPLGRGIEAAYLFWQQDTRLAARAWLGANLPPGAQVFSTASRTPGRPLGVPLKSPDPVSWEGSRNFLVLSAATGGERLWPPSRPPDDLTVRLRKQAEERWLLLKQFDLQQGGSASSPDQPRLPAPVSPRLRVYAARPGLGLGQPLGLSRAPALAAARQGVVYTDHPAYSRDQAQALIQGPGRVARVLRTPRELAGAEVELISLAQQPLVVKLGQGPWPGRRWVLAPGQALAVYFKPTAWPWPLSRVYPFGFQLLGQGPVFMRVLSDPLLLGRRALQGGQWQRAAVCLAQAQQAHPKALLPRALLAAARLKLGRPREAADLLQGQEQALERLAALMLGDPSWEMWLKQLGRFSGLYPDLLLNALSREFQLDAPWPRREGGQGNGPGFSLTILPANVGNEGELRVRLHDLWPAQNAWAHFLLGWQGQAPPEADQAAVLRAWAYGPGGSRLVAERVLRPDELPGEKGQAGFELRLPRLGPAERWQFGLASRGTPEVRWQRLRLTLDPREEISQGAAWAFWAQGASMLAQGRAGPAASILGWLERLQAGFLPGIVSHSEALIASGQKRQAIRRLQKALAHIKGRPELLAWGAARLKKLGDKEVLREYERHLALLPGEGKGDMVRP